MTEAIPHLQALLCATRQGDKAAFAPLQQCLEKPIRRFIRRLIGISDAEGDILAETLLALFRNLDRLTDAAALGPFVYRVARNLCYSELRRQGRFQTVSWETDCRVPQERIACPTATAESTFERLQLWEEVRQAMDQLPEIHRQALILHTEEELELTQIALVLSVPVGTVKSRLFHARKSLMRRLRPETLAALGISPKEGKEK